jgi:hypothetical protein
MSWTAPMTAVTGAVLTAAQWNTHVRDNLLETGPAKATASGQILVSVGPNQVAMRTPTQASIATTEFTSSASFVDLLTVGPSITVVTGTKALVFIAATLSQNTVDAYAVASYDVTGATTLAPSTSTSLNYRNASVNQQFRASFTDWNTSLNAGTNTFTMKYVANGGTAAFATRNLFVIPF